MTALLLLVFAVSPGHADVFADARAQGVPALALERAVEEARSGTYDRTDVITIFDVSQPSRRKRLFILDMRSGKVSAYFASHGVGNGPMARATSFRGFNNPDNNKTPLGPLKTDRKGYPVPGYTDVRDPVSGHVHRGKLVLGIDGTKNYNDQVNSRGAIVVFHTKEYATEGFRRRNGGSMGRSHGCIVIDPLFINEVIAKVQGGSLVYVTVGNEPIERFIN